MDRRIHEGGAAGFRRLNLPVKSVKLAYSRGNGV
jgi:hypothetical protein